MTTFTRWLLWSGVILSVIAAGILSSPQWGMLPHRYCLLGNKWLMWAYVVTNATIACTYYLIAITLYLMARNLPQIFFSPLIVYSFAAFILACGSTHVMDIVTVWWPAYYTQLGVLAVCAVASGATAIAIFRLEPAIEKFMESRGGGGG